MKNKILQEIEKKIEDNYIYDQYEAYYEAIRKCELALKFFKSKEGQEVSSKENIEVHIKQLEETLKVKRAEKNFISKLLEEKK